jgi:hypothetical protein
MREGLSGDAGSAASTRAIGLRDDVHATMSATLMSIRR